MVGVYTGYEIAAIITASGLLCFGFASLIWVSGMHQVKVVDSDCED